MTDQFRSALAPGSEGWCSDLSRYIEALVEQDSIDELQESEPRWHLGASEIGHECSRKIWFSFRWILTIRYSGKLNRLFKRGHKEEPNFIHRLRRVGINCVDRDPTTGKQLRIENQDNLHFGGSLDSASTFLWLPPDVSEMLGEFKTHNDKSFGKLLKEGVRKSKPQHYVQMSIYGRRKRFKLGLYCALNKNDDELKFTVLPLDWRQAEIMEAKALRIINAREAPPRTSEDPTSSVCNMCEYKGPCHLKQPIEANCRSCRACVALPNGEFGCEKVMQQIPRDVVPKGCQNWYPIV
jgi:hypothetical protein